MTEKETSFELARTAEQTTTDPTRLDGAANQRQQLKPASAHSQALAFSSPAFSRIEVSPELRKAMSYVQFSRLELENFHDTPPPRPARTPAGKSKTWLGVAVTCLLGALPIIALALVRAHGQGSAADAPPPLEAFETGAARTQLVEVSAPAGEDSAPATSEFEPKRVDDQLEPPVAPAPVAPIARAKNSPSLAPRTLAKPSRAPDAAAPVRHSWFHR